jgi:general secretion pathway protein B
VIAAPPPAPPLPAPVAVAPRKPALPPPGVKVEAPKPKEPASADDRIYALNELPDGIRRELPALSIGGAMYSENAANRMLIVNGLLLHEGDKVAPDLVLEQIKLKAAVLKYKSYRYQLSF